MDASLAVLESLDHEVSRRGAYVAYLGAGEFSVRLRILGSESLRPGSEGAVRLHLPCRLPLRPGDRFVLRESGRAETVGGGEILDVDPRLPAAVARPDRSVDRVIAERGWVRPDDLWRLTGERRRPNLAGWVVDPATLLAAQDDIRARIAEAGGLGLDLAGLGEQGARRGRATSTAWSSRPGVRTPPGTSTRWSSIRSWPRWRSSPSRPPNRPRRASLRSPRRSCGRCCGGAWWCPWTV